MNMKLPSLMYQVQESLRALGVEILDARNDLVRCPGEHLHTSPNKPSDCKLFGTPYTPVLKCFHSSCAEELARINQLISGGKVSAQPSAGANHPAAPPPKPVPRIDRQRINEVIAQHPWSYANIEVDCPAKVNKLPIGWHSQALLQLLFDADDVLWMGRDPYDSGKPGHRWRFRRAEDWKHYTRNLGVLTCPSTFIPGSISRSEANVKDRRYLVVESDILSRDQVGSIFQWMIGQGHHLRAVVDTAGKSLHGWFKFPGEAALPRLKSELVRLGCDPAMFGASQPCRLPGGVRDGKHQKLIYLDEEDHQPTPANNEPDTE